MEEKHPIAKYLGTGSGLGKDTLVERLKEEGFERLCAVAYTGDTLSQTEDNVITGLLRLLIKLEQDKSIKQVRIIPAYLATASTHKERQHPENAKNHSEGSNLHVVYVKREK